MKIAFMLFILITYFNPPRIMAENQLVFHEGNNNIENIDVGNKITNISNVNGDINFNYDKKPDNETIESINHLDLRNIVGFSEIYYNKNTDKFYIKEHAHEEPITKEIRITKNKFNYIAIENIKGDIVNNKTSYHIGNNNNFSVTEIYNYTEGDNILDIGILKFNY